MYSTLKQLNIELTNDQEKLFDEYIKYFCDYNQKVNLVSKNEIPHLFEKHIYDSLALNLFFEKYEQKTAIKILDIGTGGGFPSVPLAICFPQAKITAVDSINKKIKFISELKKEFNLNNLTPICSRVEELKKVYSKADVVTTRAMAELRIILEYGVPFVKTGGYFVAYKSIKADEELANAQNAIKVLNVKLLDKIQYSLPLKESRTGYLLVFKKLKDTSPVYPRQNGVIRKNPL